MRIYWKEKGVHEIEIGGYYGLCTLLCCSDGCLLVLEPVSVQDLTEQRVNSDCSTHQISGSHTCARMEWIHVASMYNIMYASS